MAATPKAQSIHFYPTAVRTPGRAHEVNFADPAQTTWEFANTGSSDHTFGNFDRVRIHSPGAAVAAKLLNLSGLVVPAGKVTRVTLPIADLAPGPWTVKAFYLDPGFGNFVTVESGIRTLGTRVDLHLPDGRTLEPGGQLRFSIALQDFPPSTQDPVYAVLFCFLSGSTPLADGSVLPLASDGILDACLSTNLLGLIAGNFGAAPNLLPPSSPGYASAAEGITVSHPGFTPFAGLPFRAAAVALDPSLGVFDVSQPEELFLD